MARKHIDRFEVVKVVDWMRKNKKRLTTKRPGPVEFANMVMSELKVEMSPKALTDLKSISGVRWSKQRTSVPAADLTQHVRILIESLHALFKTCGAEVPDELWKVHQFYNSEDSEPESDDDKQ